MNPKKFCKCNRTTVYQIIEERLCSFIIVKLVNEQRWKRGPLPRPVGLPGDIGVCGCLHSQGWPRIGIGC